MKIRINNRVYMVLKRFWDSQTLTTVDFQKSRNWSNYFSGKEMI